VPVHLLSRKVSKRAAANLPVLFHRWFTRALGIRTRLHGAPARKGGVLFVGNHVSWTDIPVVGSRLRGAFVAKSEVGAMGPVGWFADLQSTIYVDRDRRRDAGAQANGIAARLTGGGNVILFPEGTTGSGQRVLPFKSSLFAAADGVEDVLIQPFSIAYTRINGLPVTRDRIAEVAWIGDMELGPHATDFMRLGKVRAEILLHDAVRPVDFADRKALARHCHRLVANGYARLMRG
jgi:1-acyl-sn-glycerol-3-phosphate acyltransferase